MNLIFNIWIGITVMFGCVEKYSRNLWTFRNIASFFTGFELSFYFWLRCYVLFFSAGWKLYTSSLDLLKSWTDEKMRRNEGEGGERTEESCPIENRDVANLLNHCTGTVLCSVKINERYYYYNGSNISHTPDSNGNIVFVPPMCQMYSVKA